MDSQPAVRPRRKDLPDNRRAQILKAARSVFARRGYADTGIDEIATEADIGKGTVYLYFNSKEQIYEEALLEYARELDERSRRFVSEAATWHDKVRAYLDVRIEFLEMHQDFIRIYYTEFRNMCMKRKALAAELYSLFQAGEAQLAQVFAVAIAKGEVRAMDPELAAAAVSDLTRGLIDRRLLGHRRPDAKADVEFTLELICESLAARVKRGQK